MRRAILSADIARRILLDFGVVEKVQAIQPRRRPYRSRRYIISPAHDILI
jgi:hypothetical protein